MQLISTGGTPLHCAADVEYIWTSALGTVFQVQASTGAVVGSWTGATSSEGVLAAAGKVYVAAETSPGSLYVIDPTTPPGPVTVATSTLGNVSAGIAFDGTHLWTADFGGSVSIITPQTALPYPATTVSTGFTNPIGILYDGTHIWVTDSIAPGKLFKLDPAATILQTVTVGANPGFPVFDGANIWVPNSGDSTVTVVQASTGTIVATISADANNHLNAPVGASFDGERVLVTNSAGNSLTVFKAADLSFIANVPVAAGTLAPCSDGVNFWVPLPDAGQLLRF
jgi:DNA-binding beta-propeller fold protein YncE